MICLKLILYSENSYSSFTVLKDCINFSIQLSNYLALCSFSSVCIGGHQASCCSDCLQPWPWESHNRCEPQHRHAGHHHPSQDWQRKQCWPPHEADLQLYVWDLGWVQDCRRAGHPLSVCQVPPQAQCSHDLLGTDASWWGQGTTTNFIILLTIFSFFTATSHCSNYECRVLFLCMIAW